MKYFGFALVFALLFADNSCGIDLGDIGDFVIQYQLTVTNNSGQDAIIGIFGHDIRAQAVVPAGGALSETSYEGGFFDIYAKPTVDIVAKLKASKADVEAKVAQKPLDPAQAATLQGELDAINAQLKDLGNVPQGGVCWSTLKPDEEGKGGEYDYTVSLDGNGNWSVAGYCAN